MFIDALFSGLNLRAELPNDGWQIGGTELFREYGLPTKSKIRVTPEKSLGNSAVFRSISLISEKYAQAPIKLVQELDDGTCREVKHHWAISALTKKPNPDMDLVTFKTVLMRNRLMYGQHFCEIAVNSDRTVGYLYPLVSPTMMIRRDYATQQILYRYTYDRTIEEVRGSATRTFFYDELLKCFDFTLDGIQGISRLQILKEAIALGLSYEDYSARFLANDSVPRGFITSKAMIKKETKKAMREELEAATGGKNKGRIGILDAEMGFINAGISQTDAEHNAGREFQVEEVSRIWGVPLHKLGQLDKSTNNNIETQNLEFLTDCMDPIFVSMESAYNDALLTQAERDAGYTFKHDREALIAADMKTIAETGEKDVMSGVKTPDEVRRTRNLNPHKNGKGAIPLQNLGYGPLGTEPQTKDAQAAQNPDKKLGGKTENQARNSGSGGQKSGQNDQKNRSEFDKKALKEAFLPVFRDVFDRVISRETLQLENLLKKRAKGSTADDAMCAVLEFYSKQGSFMLEALKPAVRALSSVANELSEDDRADYLREAANEHLIEPYGKLEQCLRAEDPAIAFSSVKDVLADWQMNRAKIRAEQELDRLLEKIERCKN